MKCVLDVFDRVPTGVVPGDNQQLPNLAAGRSLDGVVTGDTSGVEGIAAADQATPAAVDPADALKRGELVVAPMPMVNPTLENGLAFVAGYLYRTDRHDAVTAPSASGAPTEWTQGTKSPSEPRTSRAPLPIRVMIRMLVAT